MGAGSSNLGGVTEYVNGSSFDPTKYVPLKQQ
jgi:hypothetical protein